MITASRQQIDGQKDRPPHYKEFWVNISLEEEEGEEAQPPRKRKVKNTQQQKQFKSQSRNIEKKNSDLFFVFR